MAIRVLCFVNWSKVATLAETSGLSLQRHMNDEFLHQIANSNFGGNLEAAARWQSSNPAEYQSYAQHAMRQREASLRQFVGSAGHVLSEQEIMGQFEAYKGHIPNQVHPQSLDYVGQVIDKEGMGKEEIGRVLDKVEGIKNNAQDQILQREQALTGSYDKEAQKFHGLEDDFAQEKSKALIGKTIDSVGDSFKSGNDLLLKGIHGIRDYAEEGHKEFFGSVPAKDISQEVLDHIQNQNLSYEGDFLGVPLDPVKLDPPVQSVPMPAPSTAEKDIQESITPQKKGRK